MIIFPYVRSLFLTYNFISERNRKHMKSKRVFAFLLAAVMIFTAFAATGCSQKSNNDENEKSGIVALNMFILTEDETSPTAAREVQMAIN